MTGAPQSPDVRTLAPPPIRAALARLADLREVRVAALVNVVTGRTVWFLGRGGDLHRVERAAKGVARDEPVALLGAHVVGLVRFPYVVAGELAMPAPPFIARLTAAVCVELRRWVRSPYALPDGGQAPPSSAAPAHVAAWLPRAPHPSRGAA